jgi:hypothetical protein
MTWGYWGIVSGLLALLALFFIAMEIACGTASRASSQSGGEPGAEKPGARSRRAA